MAEIRPEQVPKEARQMLLALGVNDYTASVYIAAALNAWPGMECKNTCGSYPPFPRIILPFPTPKDTHDA